MPNTVLVNPRPLRTVTQTMRLNFRRNQTCSLQILVCSFFVPERPSRPFAGPEGPFSGLEGPPGEKKERPGFATDRLDFSELWSGLPVYISDELLESPRPAKPVAMVFKLEVASSMSLAASKRTQQTASAKGRV